MEIKLTDLIFSIPGDDESLMLTTKQAKELYTQLDELFGKKQTECIYAEKDC